MIKGIIFDMDGVIVDNNDLHKQTWREFFAKHGKSISDDELDIWMSGRQNFETVQYLFKNKINRNQALILAEEKEALYRIKYKDSIKPLVGLLDFLEHLKFHEIKIGLGSSAPKSNVTFIMDGLGIAHYFDAIVDGSMVQNGKPNPEVFVQAAKLLKVNAENCIVFEDSLSGIEAAKRAGMSVVGIATSHCIQDLSKYTNIALTNFDQLTIKKIESLIQSL
jgi:beta-phosphoglucomutase family hydrolase